MKQRLESLHRSYLASLKRQNRYIFIVQLSILFSFFCLWELASRSQWIDPLLFSMPSRVGVLLFERLHDGSLLMHTSVTLFETILGFMIGTVAGIALAALLWWSPFTSRVLEPYLVGLNSMPKVALGPILIVGLGPGFTSIIAMGALISVIITTMVVYTAFKEVDPNYLKVMNTFGATKKQTFRHVIFPSCLPTMVSTLKVNVGLSWVGVIVGEFLVSKQGLGYLIIYGFQVFNFTLVLMSLLVIAVLATIMYKAVEFTEHHVLKRF